jgi:DNA-binding PadR family transcriptional regulator
VSPAEAGPPLRPTVLALTVLSMLVYEPLHPYRMQRLMQLWGKDRVVNVGQRANLYKTIKRLHEAGLVAVRQTERDQQYPERTVYELTDKGREQGTAWLTEMLSAPRNEFPEFPAALSFVMMLGPATTVTVLKDRAARLRDAVREVEAELEENAGTLPRVTMLETEYLRAVTAAELAWVEGVIADLEAGTLSWSAEELEAAAKSSDDAADPDPDPDPAAGDTAAAR